MPMWAILPFFLVGVMLIAWRCGLSGVLFASAVLLVDWIVNTAFAMIAGTQFNWLVMAAVDYTAAVALMVPPGIAVIPVASIAFIFGVEIILHAAFGMSVRGITSAWTYYWCLFVLAWAQAAIVAGWTAYEFVGVVRRRPYAERGVSNHSMVLGEGEE